MKNKNGEIHFRVKSFNTDFDLKVDKVRWAVAASLPVEDNLAGVDIPVEDKDPGLVDSSLVADLDIVAATVVVDLDHTSAADRPAVE